MKTLILSLAALVFASDANACELLAKFKARREARQEARASRGACGVQAVAVYAVRQSGCQGVQLPAVPPMPTQLPAAPPMQSSCAGVMMHAMPVQRVRMVAVRAAACQGRAGCNGY